MNKLDQRITIALHVKNVSDLWRHIMTEGKNRHGYKQQEEIFLLQMPDYTNDLNAMFAAEDSLTIDQQSTYLWELGEVVAHNHREWLNVHATAEQRAEAFLKTIDKWVYEA